MTRDPDSTRTRHLEAGREEFTPVGPAGARVNRIAERAGMNKKRILARLVPRLIQDISPEGAAGADPSLRLRTLTPDDTVHVARIFFCAVHEGAREHYTFEQRLAWGGETVDPDAWRDRLEEAMGFLAERNGEPVGFMTVDETGLIDLAFVLPSMAGQGIGTRLYRAVEDQARALGLQALTTEASKVSKPFFERQGWEVITEQSVEREGVSLTNYKMRKPL